MNLRWNFLLLIVVALFCGCQSNSDHAAKRVQIAAAEKQPELTPEVPEEDSHAEEDSVESQVDSFKVYCAEMMKTKVELPPVYQHEIFEENDEATGKFSQLSKACNGRMKVLVNSSAVVSELESTIKAASVRESDLVILIDRTYSMHDHVDKVKEGIDQIIDTLKKYKGTRLAIATYGDKNYEGNWWFKFKNFETDYSGAAQYVRDIRIIGNPDWPESVYDAVMRCIESDFWQSKKKCNIILVGDAPPQEKPLSDYSLDDVIKASRNRKVRMNFYPILILPDIKQVRLSEEDKEKYHEVTSNTKLYPNPCRGTLNLAMENTSTYYLELYDMSGNIVMNEEYFGITWSKDLSNMPNGVYILRVINKDHTFELFKFVLQH